MGDEDAFQAALDLAPYDHTTRLVFADWLQDRDDLRAEGYRALARLAAVPTNSGGLSNDSGWFCYASRRFAAELMRVFPHSRRLIRRSALPHEWCEAIFRGRERNHLNYSAGWCAYGKSRREAEDIAALAWAELSPEQRSQILIGSATEVVHST